MSFVHLHTHSHYSLLEGLPKIDELVGAAKARGFSAVALTDRNNMFGAIEFYEECQKQGIKPIIGLELYVAEGSRLDTQSKAAFALVMLALNEIGYRNLVQLCSAAHIDGTGDIPRVDKELLRQHAEGLVVLTGGNESEVADLFRRDPSGERAGKEIQELQQIFGSENVYVELRDLPAKSGQMELNQSLIEVAKKINAPLVVTRDVHYLDPDDAEAQDILTCIRDGHTVDDQSRATMVGIDYSFCSEAEIMKRFRHVSEAVENTGKIAERVDLQLALNKWHFPALNIPEGKSVDDYLREEVYQRLPSLMEVTDAVRVRADYELDVISKKGYSPYFLVVSDYVTYARTHDIVVTTRGSGAGSLVSYAMGITTVNPLYFKLPFERFLNPFRPSPPDIDVDFADDRRDDMIAYVTKKYGADKVAQIITFGTMAARGSVRDVGRALGYSYSFCDQVSKLIPFGAQGFQMTIKKAMELEPELKELYTKNGQVKRLLDLAQKIEGCARHTSMHAAGVVIAPTPLTDFTPIQRETGGEKVTTQYEMHSVEAAGLLKMDFLGIRNLSILGKAIEIIEKTTGKKIDIYSLAWDDKKTYQMLAHGDTVGVFQLSGSGMTRYLKELKPESIFDIMAMVALFRPGPMESIPDYIRRKNDPETIEYLDPRMKDYLDQSLGLIVYQDDVLLTAIHLGGYNWEEADKFRKAMGKKIPEEMMKQKEKFFKGCREVGKVPEDKIIKLWERIEPFAAYGFNKAHAASYAVVAYQTAYLKANYPIQYMTAVLIAESGDLDKVPPIIHECEQIGIKVSPPDVNESHKNFAMIPAEDGKDSYIRFGLNGIKNLGEHIADALYRERKHGGRFADLEDLLRRVKDKDLNKKSLESLAKCGALDSFGVDRATVLASMDAILDFTHAAHAESNSIQNSLFAGSTVNIATKLRLVEAPPATKEEKMKWEKELLGLYVTAHPFSGLQTAFGPTLIALNDLSGQPRESWVVVGGIIESAKKKITRSGKAMMFITIQDTTDNLELLVFPRTYETTKEVWKEGSAVCVVGKTSAEEGDDKLVVEKAYAVTAENVLDLARQMSVGTSSSNRSVPSPIQPSTSALSAEELAPTGALSLVMDAGTMKEKANDLKAILARYPGVVPVYLIVAGKVIKTALTVGLSAELGEELGGILLSENIITR